jgi:hypothetical protein
MKYIGFATQYYTLYDVESQTRYSKSADGCTYPAAVETVYAYIQNLSLDFSKAQAKAKELCGYVPTLDESLYGRSSSFKTSKKLAMPSDLMGFGNFQGYRIETMTDVWQLMRCYIEDSDPRRRVYARRQLLVLGELKKFAWTNHNGLFRNYATDDQMQKELEKRGDLTIVRGHHCEDNAKVILELKLIKEFAYQSLYGVTWIQKYVDADNREFIYMGSSPQDVEVGQVYNLKATIKHDDFRGQPQTKLLRMKIVS